LLLLPSAGFIASPKRCGAFFARLWSCYWLKVTQRVRTRRVGANVPSKARAYTIYLLWRQDLEHWLDTLPHMSAIASARQIGTEEGPVLLSMAACAAQVGRSPEFSPDPEGNVSG